MPYMVRSILSFLLLASTVATLPASHVAAQEATPGASAAEGDFAGTIDIGGRALFLTCTGEGAPTVVIDHGQWGSSVDMAPLQRELSRDTRVLPLRSGRDGPERPAGDALTAPRTAADVVTDLHALLEAADASRSLRARWPIGRRDVRAALCPHAS